MPIQDCIFCKIVAGQVPASVVYKDNYVTAFRDVNPKAPTHILVVPNRHLTGVAEVSEGDGAMLAAMMLAANQVARQDKIAESGYRLVLNQGPDAGQAVPHMHLHVLGGRAMRWPPG